MSSQVWQKANQAEKKWWLTWKSGKDLVAYRKVMIARANEVQKLLDQNELDPNISILQIGPAANGEIHFLKGKRFAIDPLAGFFKANFPELMDRDVDFIEGIGEKMPYEDQFFDVILILNVIDHCCDPELVLKEIARVIRKGGLLILDVNIYGGGVASALHQLFQFMDTEHPHALTKRFFRRNFSGAFKLIMEKRSHISISGIQSPIKVLMMKIAGHLGLAPETYRLVAERM